MTRLIVALATAAGLAACGLSDPERPPAYVTIFNRDGAPLANWPVAFHGNDGRLLEAMTTDASGQAVGPMEPDGMVTYQAPFLHEKVITHGGVQPGDHLVNTNVRDAQDGVALRLVVDTSNAPVAARLCRISVPCGNRVIEARGVPGTDVAIDLPDACAPADASGNRAVYLIATATDERAEVIAYAAMDRLTVAASPARVTIGSWNTEIVDVPLTVLGLAPDLVRYHIEARTLVGDATVAYAARDGEGPGTQIDDSVRVATRIATDAAYRVDALFSTDEMMIEQRVPIGTPLAIGSPEIPPRMSSIRLAATAGDPDGRRPAIVFSTKERLVGDVTVDALLVGPDSSWLLRNMRGPVVRLPELPAGFAGFTIDELTLDAVAATTRVPCATGELTWTTAMPHIPSTAELPL